MASREGFPRDRRLRRRAEFVRVFRGGRRLEGRFFVLIALPNGQSVDRLGLTVGRKVGKAVVRNRARRLLREGFRRLEPLRHSGCDLVVVAKKEIVGRTQGEVERELRERFRRLAPLRGPRGATAAAPP